MPTTDSRFFSKGETDGFLGRAPDRTLVAEDSGYRPGYLAGIEREILRDYEISTPNRGSRIRPGLTPYE